MKTLLVDDLQEDQNLASRFALVEDLIPVAGGSSLDGFVQVDLDFTDNVGLAQAVDFQDGEVGLVLGALDQMGEGVAPLRSLALVFGDGGSVGHASDADNDLRVHLAEGLSISGQLSGLRSDDEVGFAEDERNCHL